LIIGIVLNKSDGMKIKVTDWYFKTSEKLEKYGGGGFLGKSKLYDLPRTKDHVFMFRYANQKPMIRPSYIALMFIGLALLFSWHWSIYAIALLFGSMEFFLSKWLVYYVMALSLKKKTGVTDVRPIQAEELLEDMLGEMYDTV
jgi:hypothetical protein